MPSHLHCRCVNINKFCDEMILTSLRGETLNYITVATDDF